MNKFLIFLLFFLISQLAIMGGNYKCSLFQLSFFIHFLLFFDLHLADDVLQGNINSQLLPSCQSSIKPPQSQVNLRVMPAVAFALSK